ncbi:MAG: hypothetical protein KDC33_08955, partial [Thermoleophilia bacterium]|nr:hypothetical protein [Thermoleophilia bacterium]
MSHAFFRAPARSLPAVAACCALLAPGVASAAPVTFNSTGAPQTYTVPAGVTSVRVTAHGAQGGSGYGILPNGCPGGKGAEVRGTLAVTPGQTLYVLVGGVGTLGIYNTATPGGYNGGGSAGGVGGVGAWSGGGG